MDAAVLNRKWKARGESQTGKRLSSDKPTSATISPSVAQVILELEEALLKASGGSILEPKGAPGDGFCWIWAILGSLGYLEDSTRVTSIPCPLDWARGMLVVEEAAENAATYKEEDPCHYNQMQVSLFLPALHSLPDTPHLTSHLSLQTVTRPEYTSNGRLVRMGTFGGEGRVAAVATFLGVNVLMLTNKLSTLTDVHGNTNAIVLVDVEKFRERQAVPCDVNYSVVKLSNFIKEGRFCVVVRYGSVHFESCGTLGTPVRTCSFEPQSARQAHL